MPTLVLTLQHPNQPPNAYPMAGISFFYKNWLLTHKKRLRSLEPTHCSNSIQSALPGLSGGQPTVLAAPSLSLLFVLGKLTPCWNTLCLEILSQPAHRAPVTMTGLREEDSGQYWYRIYHASGRSVSKSVQLCPGVSLSEPLPWDPLAPFWFLLITEAWKPGCPPLAGSTGEVVGNTCPGDSHVHAGTHTHTHPLHTLSPWFTSLLKDAQTEPNTHRYAIHSFYHFGKDPVQLCWWFFS